MPKKFADEIKDTALKLFLEGASVPSIASSLSQQYNIDIKNSTIYAWKHQNKWKEDKLDARTAAIDIVKESETQRYARIQQEHLDDYGSLRKKAALELGGHTFDRPFDAAKALDIGIKGERIVMEGMINLQFVQDIMGVLVEEINDPDLLTRVAFRLKSLIQTQETNG